MDQCGDHGLQQGVPVGPPATDPFPQIHPADCLGPAWGKMVAGPHVFRVGGDWG